MDQQLSEALELHRKGEAAKALKLYGHVLKQDRPPLVAFLNASSLWRSEEKQELSIACLKQGIKLYPNEAGLWNNLANCHLDIQELTKAIGYYRQALTLKPSFIEARITLASCLRELGFANLAYGTIHHHYCTCKSNKERNRLLFPLVEVIIALAEQDNKKFKLQDLEQFMQIVETEVHQDLGKDEPWRAGLLLANLWINVDQLDRALTCRNKIVDDTKIFFSQPGKENLKLNKSFHKSWHALNWNLGIKLIKRGRFKEGWSLYEHGLQVPAKGPQRWQRSLRKPFTPGEVPFWRGEPLKGKRLLLLGEQGIGDSMMFATLIPRLQDEGAQIVLLPGDRLVNIYKRSLPDITVLSKDDLQEGDWKASEFDFQSPLGSICQYRFHQLADYGPKTTFLKADPSQTAKLRRRYSDGRPLVGISWQGGGTAKRIPLKSLKLKELVPLLQCSDYRFVSLQYGDDGPHIERFNKATGIEILHDDSINPLKDMDGWLSQVAAMDAVVSIANTTVHGAGGLGIPTMCTVSSQSDWRWIDPEVYKGCYWYPSVDACYQNSNSDWKPALSEAVNWLRTHVPKTIAA